jgi:DNA invertase Pin-like site-specific DNA recombinase
VLRLAPFTEREIRTAVNTTVRLIETAPTKVPPPASSRLPESSKERSVAQCREDWYGQASRTNRLAQTSGFATSLVLDQLRKGDVLVVWKLDRLSRSLRDVLTIMERLGESGSGFRSLIEAIDTTTPAGRMMMQMVGAFAEFERAMLKERTKAGLDAAREEGRIGGRRPKLTPQQQVEIRKMVSKGDKTAADAARLFKIHPATVSRLLARTLPSAKKAKHAK